LTFLTNPPQAERIGNGVALDEVNPVKKLDSCPSEQVIRAGFRRNVAHCALFAGIITNNSKELIEIKADRMPVAISENTNSFINHSVRLRKGDVIYMASDGYQDQFGGPNGKKFLTKRLKELLTEIYELPMPKQKDILDRTIEEWMNNFAEKFEQTDDITILGIKLF
jgi:hypothetical protein